MEYKQVVEHLLTFSKATNSSITKELNLVEVNNKFRYHIGIWQNGTSTKGLLLEHGEMKLLLEFLIKKDILKENELEKFQKDFIQQSHNGLIWEQEKER